MNIKHDKSYLNLWGDQRDAGFTKETIGKIVFDANIKDNRCITAFQTIKDWLEDNYKMYQYKKDNGIKHGEHELFYWASWQTPEGHWSIDLNERLSFDKRIELIDQIVKYLKDNYSDICGEIRLQYKNCMDWDVVNEFITDLEIDYNNIPYNKLRPIFDFQFTGDWKYLSKNNIDRLYYIQKEIFKKLEGKKVVFNGIQGTVKKIGEDNYGVFKPRATRTYYKLDMGNIKSLVTA